MQKELTGLAILPGASMRFGYLLKSMVLGMRDGCTRTDTAGGELVRYFLASAVALAVDIAALLLLARCLHYLVAASIAFVLGATVAYGLATRFVFRRRRYGDRQIQEAMMFTGIGLVGLMVNDLTIFLLVGQGALPLVAAKLAAAVATFLVNFAFRKFLLF